MKKYLGFLLFLCSTGLMFGQATATFTCNQNNGNALTLVNQYCMASTGTNVLPSGTDTHNVYVAPVGTPGSVTVILQGTVKGDFTDATTCGTATVTQNLTTAPSITCSGVYAKVRAKITALSGFTAVNITYNGTSTSTKKGGLNGVTPTSPIVATLMSGTLNISCPTCSVGSTGLTSVVMPADLYSTNTVGTVETVTKQNQNISNFWVGPQSGTYQQGYVAQGKTCFFGSGGLSYSCAFSAGVASGNLILGMIAANGSSGSCSGGDNVNLSSFTQSDGVNSYTVLDNYLVGGAKGFQAFYAKNVTGGAITVSATVVGGTSKCGALTIVEIAGLDTGTPLDQHTFGVNNGAYSPVTITTANQMVIGYSTKYQNVATLTPGVSWTQLIPSTNNSSAGMTTFGIYQDTTVTGAYTPLEVGGGALGDFAETVSFKLATAGGSASQPVFRPIVPSDVALAGLGSIYNHTGVLQVTPHIVSDICTLGTSCAVTLTGASIFSSSTSYSCVAQDTTATNATAISYSSGSAFTITGTGTDAIRYHCIGN